MSGSWLTGTSLEVKERVASLSGALAALGSAGHWSSIPPCHNPWALSSPALQHHHSQHLSHSYNSKQQHLLQQQHDVLLWSMDGWLSGQEESGWGRGWSLALDCDTESGVRHFISAQTVISEISGSLPHFSLNPAPVFTPSSSHPHLSTYYRYSLAPAWLARPWLTQTELCKSVIELGLELGARAKACQSCLPGH